MRDHAPNPHLSELLGRLQQKSATVCIIGLGYVGLPLSLRFADAGFTVLGLDIDPAKTERLNQGCSYLAHIPDQAVAQAGARGFSATTDFSRASQADALVICVPTPLTRHREPDLSYITQTMDQLLPHLRAGQLLCLESTTFPGTTAEELQPRLAACGFTVGHDFFLVFSPEREDPGNPHFNTRTIPKICGGDSQASLQAGLALYRAAIDTVVPVSSTRAAELTKLLENIHRAVNIGLVNEMKIIADRMGIDIHEVIRAASTKPFGFTPYYPGPGLGGHCIPIDPFYLTWKARQYGLHTRFIDLAGEINSDMPAWVVGKLADALNAQRQAVNGSRILVLGIAYKPNVDDMRESPSVRIMELLRDRGALVHYSDPHVPRFPPMREHHFDLSSVALDEHSLPDYDAVVIATRHRDVDYALVVRHARLIVDTRGVYPHGQARVVHA